MEKFKRALLILSVGFSLSTTSIIRADPVVQQIDRLELDWGNLKVRFFGTYKPESGSESLAYADIEKRAVSEGLVYAQDKLTEIHRDALKRQGVSSELADRSAVQAGEAVTHYTYPYQTSFFNDGSVRVSLESNLAKALARRDGNFAKDALEKRKEPRFSGLILRLDKAIKPVARYQVVDQSGIHLFGVESMTREAYEKNLMGHWLVEPQREELMKYVGAKPVSIQVKVIGEDRFMVQKGAWTDALQDSGLLLGEGRIALVLPNLEARP